MKFKSIDYMALSSPLVLGTIVGLVCLTDAAIAETLTTRQFKIEIQRNCAEGNVTCNRVSYRGTDLKTGKSIRLSGKTMHTKCADGVTPCRFIGYEFRNRDYRYIVTEYGQLDIYQGKKLILSQPGTWER